MHTSWPAISSLSRRRIHTGTDTSNADQEGAPKSTRLERDHSSKSRRTRLIEHELYPESFETPEEPRSYQPRPKASHQDAKIWKGRAASGGEGYKRKMAWMIDLNREKELARQGKPSGKDAKKLQVKDKARNGKPSEQERERSEGRPRENMPIWAVQKQALKEKFPEGWQPRKRLSPDAMAGIKELHKQFPELYTTQALSEKFEVPAEAIRRILRSKWEPSVEEEEARQARWFRRGQAVWSRWAELGIKPPKKWRDEGIERKVPPRGDDGSEDADDIDPRKAFRLKVQSRLSRNLL